ncbi:CDGP domain-containing protein [Mycobacterium sp. 4D054]|uniref:CDGP domain-containing protein n=1 Tax=Mycobacterium sp. 4D054 TaxID=3457440 RepID=UPI003FD60DBC
MRTRRVVKAAGAAAVLVTSGLVAAAPVSGQPCTGPSGMYGGNGGGRCDYPPDPDGSFIRCDTVYVLGIGGTNCYRVPPGTPPV